ncbi:tRNA-Val4 [Bacillus amyloliquefaciens]|uniref:tRNA-Val4 n=1 Tax=Bacillus amyloliquefaciens TaxID=1390 RepID=A0AAP7TCN8_BACAM|nr:tRNA-Val4 [Bacillus amyloliquefaciens]
MNLKLSKQNFPFFGTFPPSDFIEDIVSVSEANENLKLIQKVLDGSIEEYEIQLNTTIAYIKEDQTVIEHLYTESENDRNSMETEKFKELIFVWRDKIPQRHNSKN